MPATPDLLGEVIIRRLEYEAIRSHCLLRWTRIMTPEGVGGLPKVRQRVSDRASKRTCVSSTTCNYCSLFFKIHELVECEGIHGGWNRGAGDCSRLGDLRTKQLSAWCRPHLDTNSDKPTVKNHSGDNQISLNSDLGFEDFRNLLILLCKDNIIT